MRARTRARAAATNDLARAQADMDEFGYCLVAGALSDADLGAIRARRLEQSAAELSQGVRDEVLAAASPELKALLGFKTWSIYGATDDPAAAFVERRPGRIGKLP